MKNRYSNPTIFDAERQELESLEKSATDLQQQMQIQTLPSYEHKHWPNGSTHGQLVRDSKHQGHLWLNHEPIYEIAADWDIDYTDQKQQNKFWHHVGYNRCRARIVDGYIPAILDDFYTSDPGIFSFEPPSYIHIHSGGIFATTYRINMNHGGTGNTAQVELHACTQGGHIWRRTYTGLEYGIYDTVIWILGNDAGTQSFFLSDDGSFIQQLNVFRSQYLVYSSEDHRPYNYPHEAVPGTTITVTGGYLEIVRMGGAIMEDQWHLAFGGQPEPDEL